MRLAVVACVAFGCQVSPKFAGLDEETRPISFSGTFDVTTLANGMRVVVVPDSRTNLVTIDVRYEVGAADDPPGRAGMAHYAEHVMWEAGVSAHIGDQPTLADAALFSNATTTHSSTSFTTVALDIDLQRALEIEARRMEVPCITLRDELLTRERDVVLQEMALRAQTAPAMDGLSAAVWGAEHAYGRSAGGVAFADAPSTELCAFVSAHYVPRLATLVVTGAVDSSLHAKIAERFGKLPDRAPPPRRIVQRVHRPTGKPLVVAGLAQPTAMIVIPVPPLGGADDELVEVAALEVTSRLQNLGPGGNAFVLGDHRARVIVAHVEIEDERALDRTIENMTDAIDHGTVDVGDLVRDLRMKFALTFDQPRTRASRLAELAATIPKPQISQYRALEQLDHVRSRDVSELIRHGRRRAIKMLPGEVGPDDTGGRIASLMREMHRVDVARTPVDPALANAPIPLPTSRIARTLHDYRLENGLRVVLAPDPQSIVIDARLVFPHGSDGDPREQPNRAALAGHYLMPADGWDEGAYEHRLVQWYLTTVGRRPHVEVAERSTTFRTTGFGVFADWHVWNIAWTVLHGRYAPVLDTLHRYTKPRKPAPKRPAHPFAVLERALGGVERIPDDTSWISVAEVENHRRTVFRPQDATLILSGNFSVEKMEKEIVTLFGAWPTRDAAASPPPAPPLRELPRFVAIENASAVTDIVIAYVPDSSAAAADHAARAARDTLSAMLEDRMRVVREGMGVSYGVHGAVTTRYVRIAGSVDTAHAAHALAVIDTEVARLRQGGAELAADFARARRLVLGRTLADPAGASQLADHLEQLALRNAGFDDTDRLADAIRTLSLDAVTAAASELTPERRIVILRGPKKRLETAFDALDVPPQQVEWAPPE